MSSDEDQKKQPAPAGTVVNLAAWKERRELYRRVRLADVRADDAITLLSLVE